MQELDIAKIRLIIVDFDGPIHDLTSSKIAAAESLCKKLNVKLSKTTLSYLLNYIEQIYERRKIVDYQKILDIAMNELVKQGLIELDTEEKRYFIKNFPAHLNKYQVVNRELIHFIKKIKAKEKDLRVCVYSNQNTGYVKGFLNKFKIDLGVFDKIYGRNSFEEPKPSINNLKKICRDFGASYKQTVIVGDNVAVDLMPAKLLKIKTILYTEFVDYRAGERTELEEIFLNK